MATLRWPPAPGTSSPRPATPPPVLRPRPPMTAHPLGLTEDEAVLVVCAHPDDETLGAGRTIHRLASSGITVHVLAVCCYPESGQGTPSDTLSIQLPPGPPGSAPGRHSCRPTRWAHHRHAPRIVLGFTGPEDGWSSVPDSRPVFVDTTASWPAKERPCRRTDRSYARTHTRAASARSELSTPQPARQLASPWPSDSPPTGSRNRSDPEAVLSSGTSPARPKP